MTTENTQEEHGDARGGEAPNERLVMSDLATLTQALDLIGIEYVVRQSDEYHYLFFGECRNIHNLDLNFETSNLDTLLRCHKFMEFENGKLASYFNS